MRNYPYPTFEELNTAPDFLEIGVVAMLGLSDAGWILPIVHELTTDERAEYQQLHSDKRRGWIKTKFGGKRIA